MKHKAVICIAAGVLASVGVGLWLHRAPSPQILPPATRSIPASPSQTALPARTRFEVTSTPVPSRPIITINLQGVSPALRPMFATNAPYAERLASACAAQTNLTAANREAVYGFLLHWGPKDEDPWGQGVKNGLMDVLCDLNPPPPGWGEVLVQIYRDRSQNVVLRDYAIQHLAAFYGQMKAATGVEAQDKSAALALVQDTLWEAAGEPDSSIAGTALLALTHLADGHVEIDRERIGAAALQLCVAGIASELTRITALQVCGQLGVKAALPQVIQVVQSRESLALRISAVGVLGALGGTETKPVLQEILDGSEERLKPAARQALNRIQQQEQQQAQATTGKI